MSSRELLFDSKNIKDILKDPKEKNSKVKGKHVSVFKFGAEARKTVQDKNESNDREKSSNGFKCEICNYSCKKHTTLKKNINLNHTEQK